MDEIESLETAEPTLVLDGGGSFPQAREGMDGIWRESSDLRPFSSHPLGRWLSPGMVAASMGTVAWCN